MFQSIQNFCNAAVSKAYKMADAPLPSYSSTGSTTGGATTGGSTSTESTSLMQLLLQQEANASQNFYSGDPSANNNLNYMA